MRPGQSNNEARQKLLTPASPFATSRCHGRHLVDPPRVCLRLIPFRGRSRGTRKKVLPGGLQALTSSNSATALHVSPDPLPGGLGRSGHRAVGRQRGGLVRQYPGGDDLRAPQERIDSPARGPWRTLEEVEFAALEWIDWFNNRRIFGALGNIPPAESEALYDRRQETPAREAGLT
jgi:transposase InsO family protein